MVVIGPRLGVMDMLLFLKEMLFRLNTILIMDYKKVVHHTTPLFPLFLQEKNKNIKIVLLDKL